MENPRQFELSVGGEVGREYNQGFERMKVGLRRLHAPDRDRLTYRTSLLLLFLIRLGCIFTAAQGNLAASLVLVGGLATMPGFKSRLNQELKQLLATDKYNSLKIDSFMVHKPPGRPNFTQWLGW